jgi:hypothetical protein
VPEHTPVTRRSVPIRTSRGRSNAMAECETCGWYCDASRTDLTRQRARRHAATHAHKVFVLLERGTYYDGTPAVNS